MKKYIKDDSGHEHAPAGSATGGQFTGGGGGGGSSSEEGDKTPKKEDTTPKGDKTPLNEDKKPEQSEGNKLKEEYDESLSPEELQNFKENYPKWLEKIPEAVRNKSKATIKFYTKDALMKVRRSFGSGGGEIINGFCEHKRNPQTGEKTDWHIHSDGATTGPHDDSHSSDMTEAEGTFLHEFTHSIDEDKTGKISDSSAWKKIWKTEVGVTEKPTAEFLAQWKKVMKKIKYRPKGVLSAYASSSEAEGFAEFGRLVYNIPEVAAQKFPKAFQFFKERGLI